MNLKKLFGWFLVVALVATPVVFAAYTLQNNGVFAIDHDSLLVDGSAIDTYILSVAPGGGSNVTAFDYIIWVDSGTYYCQNGETGAITNNANFYTLTNTIFTACSGGETIYIKPGTYTLTTRWVFTKSLNIVGSNSGTIIDFTGTTGAILYNATIDDGIRYASLRNMRIMSNSLIGIQIDTDSDSVFSSCTFDNIYIENCTTGIYFSDNGTTVYRNTFNQIKIFIVSEYGFCLLGGCYNTFSNIEATIVGDDAFAIYSFCTLSVWENVATDGCIQSNGSRNVWNAVSIETIDCDTPPSEVAFFLAGESTVINSLIIAEVANSKCPIGIKVYNGDQTINGFQSIGTDYPEYPIELDEASSSGVINSAYKVGGYTLSDIYPDAVFSGWVINGGNIIDGVEGSSSVKTHPIQTKTLENGVTTFTIYSDVIILTGDAGVNTIATITGGTAGQRLTMIFTNDKVVITDTSTHAANTVDLSAAFTSVDDTVLTLIFDGTSWYETSRSVN